MSHHSRSSLHSSRKSSASKTNITGASTSKRNVAFDSKLDKPVTQKKNIASVYDENGEDVTPKSLLPQQVTEAAVAAAANANPGSATGKVQGKGAINFNDTASIQTPSDLFNQSGMYGAASTYQRSSYAAGFSQSLMSSMLGSRASLDSITDEIAEPNQGRVEPSGLQGISRQAADIKEDLTKEDLEVEISVTLSETDTIWHLDLPGISVQSGTTEADVVTARNAAYEKLLENRPGNDMFVERSMQTYNDAPKNKEVQTENVGMKDADCMATTWDMYETYNEKEKKKVVDQEEDDLLENTTNALNTNSAGLSEGGNMTESQAQSGSTVPESKASFMSASHASVAAGTQTVDQATPGSPRKGPADVDVDEEAKRIFKLDSMKENVFVMERTIVQNIFHQRQAAYRGLPPLSAVPATAPAEIEGEQKEEKPAPEEDLKIGPNLSRLWSYACPDTKGKRVNSMGWNKVNKDLLAVGYGDYDHNTLGKGILCVWSIKNPEHPERIYETRCAVTSLDFSMGHPNLLAVGLYDGTVQVFNIRSTVNSPILDSLENPNKHLSAVWELMWVERDKGTGEEKGEVLISGSGDGRITQWTIRKGFESLDMLKLKRVNVAKQSTVASKKGNEASKKSDALISRYTSGMCFDFHTKDGNIYMVGTEEGHIHKCSCSYNEQFLDTYSAHTGPVYCVIWSPFDEAAFLSCSADWSICLWHQDKLKPLLTLQAASKAIHSIDWSPNSPTMFAAVNDDQIEIWDLAVSILDPLLVNLPISKASLTSVLFAQNSEALLVGDAEGQVTIYYMREMPPIKAFRSDWLSSIANSKTNNAEEQTT
jgi:WD40 repeat protein